MRLLLSSLEDRASINIRDRLLEMADWTEIGTFSGRPAYRRDDDVMVTIERPHLFSDDIDASVSQELGFQIERVLFLSRHKAASGIPTLTVHPIGNYGTADFGGRPGELVLSDPELMTALLIKLTESAKGLPFQVSFETTHHGPWMKQTHHPTSRSAAGRTTGGMRGRPRPSHRQCSRPIPLDDPIAIGVGGGHYAPRFSEVCLTKRISFGHMVPNYAIEKVDDAIALERLGRAAEASKAELVYIHRKSMSRSRATELKELARSLGLEAVDSHDLEDRSV